jgi:hypothetical protein
MKSANNEIKMTKKAMTKKWAVRIFAILLSLLMVGGTLYYAILAIAGLL